jgi:hypothetical protein
MGIQIYIKKSALDERGIKYKTTPVTRSYCCECGQTQYGYCGNCEEDAYEEIHEDTVVDGLSLTMEDFGETMYHDANHWGSSRAPIIEFINRNCLLAGEDWFEA